MGVGASLLGVGALKSILLGNQVSAVAIAFTDTFPRVCEKERKEKKSSWWPPSVPPSLPSQKVCKHCNPAGRMLATGPMHMVFNTGSETGSSLWVRPWRLPGLFRCTAATYKSGETKEVCGCKRKPLVPFSSEHGLVSVTETWVYGQSDMLP